MKFITRLLVILLLPVGCFAQFTISGRILNQADTRPVANASIFINNTTIGNKTDNDGNFKLQNLKPGKYQLVVSIVGFDKYDQTVTVTSKDEVLPGIVIFPKTIALSQVTIKPTTDAYQGIYFNWFKEQFLGKSELAKNCKILNPDLLNVDFDTSTGRLTASSEDFLEIENPGLGYKLKYLLTDFLVDTAAGQIHYEGSVLFTEMAGTPSQENKWQQKRQETYEGSMKHFLHSAINDRLEEDGFKVLQLAIYANPGRPPESLVQAKLNQFGGKNPDSLAFWKKKEKLLKLPKTLRSLMPFTLSKKDIIIGPDGTGIVVLGCEGDGLVVMYNKNHRYPDTRQLSNWTNLNYILDKNDNNQLSLLNFKQQYTFFDDNGDIINPNSLEFKGAWAKNRVGDLLPMNYEPPQNKNAISEGLLKNDTVLTAVTGKLKTFTTDHPAEKVYLHLDKPHYAIGDTIWFKAYTVIGEAHKLSALSGVLYAELINQKDSVVKRLTLPLIAGAAWGDFTIARSNKPGLYHIRAYTNWMRNAGPGCFYNQRIQVGGLKPSFAQAKQTAALNPDVQFFPEGGQLVNGIRSRVAIKAVNSSGLGQDIKGTIEDDRGNVVADFATAHLGMGVFAFIPQRGKSYKAKISGTGESGFTLDLPKAVDEGYTLALNNSLSDSIFIKVAVNEKVLADQKNNLFYIVAQNNGKVYYTSKSKLEGLVYTAKVDKARFPSGITQFTLFSQSGEPLAERIAFIQNNDTLKLNITSPAATYTTRQAVKIELLAKGGSGLPVTGNFSVAVINESRVGVDENDQSTILNNLLLTSDLKGYIEQPNYYFTNVNDQSNADLDLLMLTQGYRSFEWKQVSNNNSQTISYQPERSLELNGTLKTPKGLAVPNGKITLVATRQNVVRDTVTDAIGNFKFDNLDLPDTAKLVIRARKENKGSNVAIYVKQPDYPAVIKVDGNNTVQALSPEIAALMQKDYEEYQQQKKLDSIKNGIVLKEVKITGRLIHKPDVYNNYGAVSEYDVDMARLGREFSRIEDALTLVIPGLNGLNHHYAYENRPIKILIDGFPGKADDLNYFSPKEVESIRMVSGTGLSPPTLLLTTKRYAGTDTVSTVKLKQVNIQGKKIKPDPYLAASANLHGGGNADQVIMGKDLGSCVDLSDCLQGKIFGVNFSLDGKPVSTMGLGGPMSIIVDGNVRDGVDLNEVDVSDIYSIEVLRSVAARAVYGTSVQKGGVLIITMKRGGEDNTDPATDTTALKQVNINAKKIIKKPELTHSDNLNGPGNADQVIMGDKLGNCINLVDCFNGKMAGVVYENNVFYLYRNLARAANATPPMAVIIDGSIMDQNVLGKLTITDIYSIEVLKNGNFTAIYGSIAAGGVLVITTKRGGENSYATSETPSGIITYPFAGFYKARTFYTPRYSGPKNDTQAADLRNTIYWAPNIVTGKDGKASFEYFNNDTKGVYRVVVEGIDDDGNLGRQVYRYRVE